MIRATLETVNFVFESYGQSVPHAVNALMRGLRTHAEEYGLPAVWADQIQDQIETQYFDTCRAYRNREPISK